MDFPEPHPESFTPIFVTYCIDYRYNAISAEFLDEIDYENSYYLSTTAGASLALGYEKACKNINNCNNNNHARHVEHACLRSQGCNNINKCNNNCNNNCCIECKKVRENINKCN